jgi:hypothetical protein
MFGVMCVRFNYGSIEIDFFLKMQAPLDVATKKPFRIPEIFIARVLEVDRSPAWVLAKL